MTARAVLLGQQQRPTPPPLEPPETPPPALTYDPTVSIAVQNEAWTCSVYAGDWCLRSLGIASDDETLEAEMLAAGTVTPEWGLMDARGYGLASILRRYLPPEATVTVEELVTWPWLLAHAGDGPIALGGRGWNHWCAVRDATPHGTIRLANSAPGHQQVWQELNASRFNALGPFSAVRIEV